MKHTELKLLKFGYYFGLLGVLQYTVVTVFIMGMYPGGNLADRSTNGYHFWLNFLSDLGRTRALSGADNPAAPFYLLTLSLAGLAAIAFFLALGYQLSRSRAGVWVVPMTIAGIAAGIGYIGIAVNPMNVSYWPHRWFVQFSFIGFLLASVMGAAAIRQSPQFSSRYGRLWGAFALILALQIVLMLFGPRSWSNGSALFWQVSAQKVVVYGEIFTMMIISIGALRMLRKYHPLQA